MRRIWIIGIFLSFTFLFAQGPQGYKYLGKEGQAVFLKKSSTVAYGAKGKFVFKEGLKGQVVISNTLFGDPIPGVIKYAYYKEEDSKSVTGQNSLAGYTFLGNEGQKVFLRDLSIVAYGANGKYVFKKGLQGNLQISNAIFGDPAPGVVKKAYYKLMSKTDIQYNGPEGFAYLGKDGDVVNLDNYSAIAYGVPGNFKYYYRMKGQIKILQGAPDHIPNVLKYAYYKITDSYGPDVPLKPDKLFYTMGFDYNSLSYKNAIIYVKNKFTFQMKIPPHILVRAYLPSQHHWENHEVIDNMLYVHGYFEKPGKTLFVLAAKLRSAPKDEKFKDILKIDIMVEQGLSFDEIQKLKFSAGRTPTDRDYVLDTRYDYSYIDDKVKNIPESETRSIGSVTRYIKKWARNERERVRGAFYWISENIKYGLDKFISPNQDDIFMTRKGVCHNYTQLFTAFARELNFVTHYANGRVRGNGSHAWNIVRIDGVWWPIDTTWHWWIRHPYDFITSHVVTYLLGNQFQLLKRPITKEEFLNEIQYGNYRLLAPYQNIKQHLMALKAPDGFQLLGKDGETKYLKDYAKIAYGVPGNFKYYYMVKGNIKISRPQFPDHIPGVEKIAFYQYSSENPPKDTFSSMDHQISDFKDFSADTIGPVEKSENLRGTGASQDK